LAQWHVGTNHSLTVAGAAAELRGSCLHAHRFPVSPRQRNLHRGTLHIPLQGKASLAAGGELYLAPGFDERFDALNVTYFTFKKHS
jgi:hypothetical protein